MVDRWYTAESAGPQQLTKVLTDPRLKWIYAERMEDTVLIFLKDLQAEGVEIGIWDHGRAFSQDIEIAWWRSSTVFALRAFVGDGQPPEGVQWLPDPVGNSLQAAEPCSILLIGERDPEETSDPPTWSIARVPRYLNYPVEGEITPRIVLNTTPYRLRGVLHEQCLNAVTGVPGNG